MTTNGCDASRFWSQSSVKSVMMSIEDARQEALIREQGRQEAAERD